MQARTHTAPIESNLVHTGWGWGGGGAFCVYSTAAQNNTSRQTGWIGANVFGLR